MAPVTIFAILSWWIIPEEKWLPREQVMRIFNVVEEEATTQPEQEVQAGEK